METQAKVAEYIRSHGITQAFIASKTGYSTAKVSQIMNCKQKMTADEFINFCRVLKKEPTYFVNIKE